MANRHFAQMGDIWKHLPLADILAAQAPTLYWESHAGQAEYRITQSWEREYGALHFRRHMDEQAALAGSRFAELLRALMPSTTDGDPAGSGIYPGSPRLAMSVLGAGGSRFHFCDLDADSLASIVDCGRGLGIAPARIETYLGDGIERIWSMADSTAVDPAEVLVFLDPYRPEAVSGNLNRSCIELFGFLARRGFGCILWYGFHARSTDGPERRTTSRGDRHRGLRTQLGGQDVATSDSADGSAWRPPVDTRLWCGEVYLSAMNRPDFHSDPGVHGCGILCANLNSRVTARCEELGRALCSIYETARLPSGDSGALQFAVVELGKG